MNYLGIDFGTSGARAIAIDRLENIVASQKVSYDNISNRTLIQTWETVLYELIAAIPVKIKQDLKAIAINGTSSTVLLCDNRGKAIATPIIYNDDRGKSELDRIKSIAPQDSVAIGATSSLAKLLWWQKQTYFKEARYLLHQADWLSYLLHGKLGISDYHNALKLGYDVVNLCYPDWLHDLPYSYLYPQVLAPGAKIGYITPQQSDRLNLPHDCVIKLGTTDSIAAFLASGASQAGEAVTSLGSTLVLKLLSQTRISSVADGIYSHRLGNLWLAGGASNTGGAVLKHFFSDNQLAEFSQQIDLNTRSNLEYYPLLKPGDRFPINDPNLQPQLSPRPEKPEQFLQGLLEGISRIEALGYQKLQTLGGDRLTRVYTAGGGAQNLTWQKIRQAYLNVPVSKADNTQAAYGTALLTASQTVL